VNLFRKMTGFFRREVSLANPKDWTSGEQSHAGEVSDQRGALELSAAWACGNLLAGTIASLPLMVYRTDKAGSRVVAKEHPLYRVLHDSPNADQTALDFWEFMTVSIEFWGNAFARIDRLDNGAITGVTPVHPQLVAVRRLSNGEIEYRWSEYGVPYVRRQDDMLHIRGFGGDPLGGLSTLSHGRHVLGIATATDKSAGKMFANGMRPQVALVYKEFFTPEQRTEARTLIEQHYIGTVNAGRPLMLEGGIDIKTIGINPEDAQMLETRSFAIEEICRLFGVPPFMIGHNEKNSGYPTSLEQQVLTFQKFTLRRRLKRIEQAIEKQMLTPADRAAGISIEFNIEGLLRGDSAARAAFYRELLNVGVMTINQARALENWPPVEGGDVPRMQMQNVPITEARGLGHNGGPPLENTP